MYMFKIRVSIGISYCNSVRDYKFRWWITIFQIEDLFRFMSQHSTLKKSQGVRYENIICPRCGDLFYGLLICMVVGV